MKGNCSEFPIEISRWEKFLIAENIEEQDFKSNPKILKFIREKRRQVLCANKSFEDVRFQLGRIGMKDNREEV